MTDEPLPQSTHRGVLTILGVELIVHKLDNGQTIIEGDGIPRLLDAMMHGPEVSPEDVEAFAQLMRQA